MTEKTEAKYFTHLNVFGRAGEATTIGEMAQAMEDAARELRGLGGKGAELDLDYVDEDDFVGPDGQEVVPAWVTLKAIDPSVFKKYGYGRK